MHVEWSIRALEAGKHVLCEKPLAARAADAERAFAAAESAGLLLSEAFMYRHHPQTRRLAELVAEGAIGEPRAVRASFSFRLDDPQNVRMLQELDGGSLMDVGCYCVSGTRLVAGAEPERVFGEAVERGGVDVRFSGSLRFPGAAAGELPVRLRHPARPRPRGDRRRRVAVPRRPLARSRARHRAAPGGASEQIPVERANSYRLELDDMSDAIRSGRAPLLGRDDALGQARALEALLRSAEQGSARDGRMIAGRDHRLRAGR